MAVVAVGVGGGIAAYKVCQVVRRLAEHGQDVHVIPTDSALEFVGRPTWEALSGHSVHSGVFDDVPGVEHVEESVAVRLHDDLARPAFDLNGAEHRSLHSVVVERIVR